MHRKSNCCRLFGLSAALMLAAFALFRGTDAIAQTLTGVSVGKTEEVDTDALVCWWISDKGSVRIGEAFTVALTCRIAETGRARTVLNESLLDPGAVTLPPYQVKSGKRYKDLVRILPGPEGPVTLRHVQYAYTVRLMGEGFFGKDVPLPPLEIRYRIDLVTNRDAVAPGKERVYLLPPMPIRIQSLVPRTAVAIREAGGATFGDIEHRRRIAAVAFIAAGTFLLLPLLVLFPILVRTVRGREKGIFNGTVFRGRDLLRRLARELNRVEKNRRAAPWDDASIGTVLSVFRVAGALALGGRIIQTPVEIENRGREGQLKFRKGLWPRTKVLVSASLTPEEMADELASSGWQGAAASERKALLDETQRAFAAFNDARYAMPGKAASREELDSALDTGLRLLRELRRDRCPVVRMTRAVFDGYTRWRRPWKRS